MKKWRFKNKEDFYHPRKVKFADTSKVLEEFEECMNFPIDLTQNNCIEIFCLRSPRTSSSMLVTWKKKQKKHMELNNDNRLP